jgi:hypothetical protein
MKIIRITVLVNAVYFPKNLTMLSPCNSPDQQQSNKKAPRQEVKPNDQTVFPVLHNSFR